VRLISAYIGGGFGGKIVSTFQCVACRVAALHDGRFKASLTRPLMFNNITHLPANHSTNPHRCDRRPGVDHRLSWFEWLEQLVPDRSVKRTVVASSERPYHHARRAPDDVTFCSHREETDVTVVVNTRVVARAPRQEHTNAAHQRADCNCRSVLGTRGRGRRAVASLGNQSVCPWPSLKTQSMSRKA